MGQHEKGQAPLSHPPPMPSRGQTCYQGVRDPGHSTQGLAGAAQAHGTQLELTSSDLPSGLPRSPSRLTAALPLSLSGPTSPNRNSGISLTSCTSAVRCRLCGGAPPAREAALNPHALGQLSTHALAGLPTSVSCHPPATRAAAKERLMSGK